MSSDPTKAPPGFYEGLVARHGTDSVVVTDARGVTVWVNEAFLRLSEFGRDEIVGLSPGTVLQGPETDPHTVAEVARALEERRPIQTEILNYTKSGRPYWIEMRITPVFDETGRHTHFLASERDVTERRALEQKNEKVLERERHRENERTLLTQINEWLYSAKSLDELLHVTRKAMSTLIPEAEGRLYIYTDERDTLEVASAWGEQVSIDPVNPDQCWALRRGRAYAFGTRPIEFACEHVGSEDHPYFCLPIVADGETIGMLHLKFPAFDLKTMDRRNIETFIHQRWSLCLLCAEQMSLAIANVRLRHVLLDQSVRDPLTKLWNRRWLVDTTNRMIAQARSGEIELSIVACDIDHFKQFNDQFGHDAGDLVLREMGDVLTDVARDRGAVCRTGGEEFVILCPGLSHPDALALGEDIRSALALLSLRYEGKSLPEVTVSAGVSSYMAGATAQALLRAADAALYEAKANGRNRVVSAYAMARPPDPARPDAAAS